MFLLFQAGLEGLEQCPFCPFATIMDVSKEENKVFNCLNPDCGQDSCRHCGERSHLPLKCDALEDDAGVRKRTYIENKMAEALIRKCYNCQRPFVKQVLLAFRYFVI
jgi:TRIAD3 protein (E3 ubiquitin-protein ligase RNF216)